VTTTTNKKSFNLILFLKNHLITYPTPSNLNYAYGFGFISGLCLSIQIASGLFLAMYYTPHIDYAFDSVEYIMRAVNYGWLLRYTHANGASFFFIAVYAHIGRGLYYRSYVHPREKVWYTGVIIFILLMATAFLGYVLPWGQMGYWGATVITNLFTVVPFFGIDIAYWLWGGFTVSNATLNRFFVLHFLLPIILAAVVILHLIFLHKAGSNNPMGATLYDDVKFFPYYVIKDLFGFLIFILLFGIVVFFYPNLLGHPDNYIKANPLCTPPHIVPEWYFLPFYAILRAVPNKTGGVILMGGAIAVMFLLPTVDKQSPFKSPLFRFEFRFFFWAFIGTVILLMIFGTLPADEPFTTVSRMLTTYYFSYFLIVLPALGWFEYTAIYEPLLPVHQNEQPAWVDLAFPSLKLLPWSSLKFGLIGLLVSWIAWKKKKIHPAIPQGLIGDPIPIILSTPEIEVLQDNKYDKSTNIYVARLIKR